MVSLSQWVQSEILSKYPNKSNFIEEAVIKLHMDKQKVLNKNGQDSQRTHSQFNGVHTQFYNGEQVEVIDLHSFSKAKAELV